MRNENFKMLPKRKEGRRREKRERKTKGERGLETDQAMREHPTVSPGKTFSQPHGVLKDSLKPPQREPNGCSLQLKRFYPTAQLRLSRSTQADAGAALAPRLHRLPGAVPA